MNLEEIKVRADLPYPEIVDATTDYSTVGILKNLATSSRGELAGVLQYIYQSVVADKTHSEIADIFEEIAIVEMTHLDLLMHAITDFGGIPKYEDANGAPFNVSNINYSVKLRDMLQNNIKAEQMAIDAYTQAIGKVKNPSLKQLLERIVMDEKLHLEAFNKILNTVTFMSI